MRIKLVIFGHRSFQMNLEHLVKLYVSIFSICTFSHVVTTFLLLNYNFALVINTFSQFILII